MMDIERSSLAVKPISPAQQRIKLNGPDESLFHVDLNPDLYSEVRINISSAGTSPENWLGHSMIHLRTHTDHWKNDVIISYRGQVNDFSLNLIKGFTDEYTLRPYAFLFKDSLLDYVTKEGMSLKSYKLLLSLEEKTLVINTLHRDFWNLKTKYHFVKSNCNSQLKNLLQRCFSQRYHQRSRGRALTPNALIRSLAKTGMICDETAPLHFVNLENYSDCENHPNFAYHKASVEQNLRSVQRRYRKLLAKTASGNWVAKPPLTKAQVVEVINQQYEYDRELHQTHEFIPTEITKRLQIEAWLSNLHRSSKQLLTLKAELERLKSLTRDKENV